MIRNEGKVSVETKGGEPPVTTESGLRPAFEP